jgi:YegS/Rv2252/BmrU family lipid kinase
VRPEPSLASSALRREVVILANPLAGTQSRVRASEELVQALSGVGLDASICWQREELAQWVQTRQEQLCCVVAAGGDGTVNEVLNRVPGAPLAILPLGNENLIARHFRFPSSPARLAQTIAHATPRRLDLARVEGRYFSIMAGAGLDAAVVHHVHSRRRTHINKLHYVAAIGRCLARYPYPRIEATLDSGEQLHGAMVFVFNLAEYGLRLPIAPRARADDGLLDVVVFQRPGLMALLRYLAAVVLSRHERLPDVQHRQARRIQLRAEQPVPLQVDGDPAGYLPVTIEVAPGLLHLLAPPGVSASAGSPIRH